MTETEYSDIHANSSNTSNSTFLKGWTRVTTRVLREGGPYAFDILDDPLRQPSEDDDDDESPSQADKINGELMAGGIFQKLSQARTTSEVKVDNLLQIIANNSFISNNIENLPSPIQEISGTKITAEKTTIRGDRSFFVPRAERQSTSFRTNFPTLAQLISSLEDTVQKKLPEICLCTNLTSVQVAEYPGDGRSGYPRHCDRIHCATTPENTLQGPPDTITTPERILTAVYYLNDSDWDANLDGGALRVFHSPATSADKFTDVVPYANRMLLFRSDCVKHQVLPTLRRPRRAITIWLYGTINTRNTTPPLQTNLSGIPTTQEDQTGMHVTYTHNTRETPGDNADMLPSKQNDLVLPFLPLPIPSETGSYDGDIFVSIAAYRDSETGPTLRHLFDQAQNPRRIFVGLVLQVDLSSAYDRDQVMAQLPNHEWWYRDHVRTIQLEARHASGTCPARAMAQLLHRNERYILQIDSHMRFRKNWDTFLVQELAHCPDPRLSVLTTYPLGYQLDIDKGFIVPNNETRGSQLVPWKFDSDGMLRQKGQLLTDKPVIPVLSQLFAAGFCFGPSDWIRDCPYDGSLHSLFFGEEQSMAVRLFSSGYNLYAPTQSVCYHLWSRAHRPPPVVGGSSSGAESDGWKIKERVWSQQQIHQQLKGDGPGLGNIRSCHDWEKAIGVNFEKRTIHSSPRIGSSDSSAKSNLPLHSLGDQAMQKILAFLD